MDTFQKSVLIIALFVLIALLISVGILLNKHSKNTNWPPSENTCPDYWTEGTDGTCNVGDLNKGNGTQNDTKNAGSSRCEKRTWAINNDIMWTGVSNYNGCD